MKGLAKYLTGVALVGALAGGLSGCGENYSSSESSQNSSPKQGLISKVGKALSIKKTNDGYMGSIEQNLGRNLKGNQRYYPYMTAENVFTTDDRGVRGLEWSSPEIDSEGKIVFKFFYNPRNHWNETDRFSFKFHDEGKFNIRCNGQIVTGDKYPDVYFQYGKKYPESSGDRTEEILSIICDKEFKELYERLNIKTQFGTFFWKDREIHKDRAGVKEIPWKEKKGIYRKVMIFNQGLTSPFMKINRERWSGQRGLIFYSDHPEISEKNMVSKENNWKLFGSFALHFKNSKEKLDKRYEEIEKRR